MKKIISPLLIIICAAALACKSNEVPRGNGYYKFVDTAQINTVKKNVMNYAAYCNSRPFHTPIVSYEILSVDLIELLNPGLPIKTSLYGVRAYLGIQDSVLHSGDTIKTTHLYLTPIKSDTQDSMLIDSKGQQFLYDLTTPCPKTCDTSSALYKAFNSVWHNPSKL